MIDEFFKNMSDDNFSHWTIHSRVRRRQRHIFMNIPHELADAEYFLNNVSGTLLNLLDEPQVNSDFLPIEVHHSSNNTRFQSIIRAILRHIKTPEDSLIGIAVRLQHKDILDLKQRNQIALPLFKASEVLDLCQQDRADWKSILLNAGIKNREKAQPILKRVKSSPQKFRLKSYEKLPLNNCDLIISYWGDIRRANLGFSDNQLSCLDFAVSATKGPKKICVVWSVGAKTFARICKSADEPWDSPLYGMDTGFD